MIAGTARTFLFIICSAAILGGIYFLVQGDYFRGFLGLVSGIMLYRLTKGGNQ